MSTNAIIARPTKDDGWEGRYHHWDGYPTALGRTLYTLAQKSGPFHGNVWDMLHTLIDKHTAWSTIVDADWSKPIGFHDETNDTCARCSKPRWSHSILNYAHRGLRTPEPYGGSGFLHYDHSFEDRSDPWGPQCYCHGSRHENGDMRRSTDNDPYEEWLYVVNPVNRTIAVYDTGPRVIRLVATVDIDGPEPDWEAIEKRVNV